MSEYKIDENELNRAITYLEGTKIQLQKCANRIFDASYSITNQTGASIDSGRNRSNFVAVNIKRQMDNITSIQECIRYLINDANDTVNNIKSEIAKIDVGKNLKNDSGIVINGTVSNNESSSTQYQRKMYYNCTFYSRDGVPDSRSIYNVSPTDRFGDTESSCMINSYTMLLNSLGIDVLPGEVYEANGVDAYHGNSVEHSKMSTFGVTSSGPQTAGMQFGNAAINEQRIKEVLINHPEGIIIGAYQGGYNHAMYAFLDANNQIRINDPGQVNPYTGEILGGENVSIEGTIIHSWANISMYITVSKN